ncbi:uncharacterized protein LOC129753103 [Uranotaenia lowii]|uniref:uncharacterized protein LOC129753103 n=1 Tax=Uranotaenia lowii TaxID=190385 RepID=UPI00247932BE|nr:uncharacterized protein LOC129753103 [Uranotaenia lowii]
MDFSRRRRRKQQKKKSTEVTCKKASRRWCRIPCKCDSTGRTFPAEIRLKSFRRHSHQVEGDVIYLSRWLFPRAWKPNSIQIGTKQAVTETHQKEKYPRYRGFCFLPLLPRNCAPLHRSTCRRSPCSHLLPSLGQANRPWKKKSPAKRFARAELGEACQSSSRPPTPRKSVASDILRTCSVGRGLSVVIQAAHTKEKHRKRHPRNVQCRARPVSRHPGRPHQGKTSQVISP